MGHVTPTGFSEDLSKELYWLTVLILLLENKAGFVPPVEPASNQVR